jgi:alpha-beta hydrolase superfamily lysophospholipase
MRPDLAHALTDDGWRLAVHRYAPSGPVRRRHPVVLCHGLGANRVGFDPHPDVSLARHLAARGYTALVVELRGHGDSERPSRTGPKRFGWAFDDYLLRDVPALLAHASASAGGAPAHWIGHSMGGLLAYAHLARGRSDDLRSAVTVGSSLDYSASRSGFHALLPFDFLIERLPHVPVDLLARLAGALVGRVVTPYERFNVCASNTAPEVWKQISERGFHAVSPPVMAQLASAMRPGGLRSRDGATAYLDGLGQATAPLLALAGDRDAQCPPDAARRTFDAVGSARRELLVFGREQGHSAHYGHFDLLVGRRARDEVFPHIDAWLDEHDG